MLTVVFINSQAIDGENFFLKRLDLRLNKKKIFDLFPSVWKNLKKNILNEINKDKIKISIF